MAWASAPNQGTKWTGRPWASVTVTSTKAAWMACSAGWATMSMW